MKPLPISIFFWVFMLLSFGCNSKKPISNFSHERQDSLTAVVKALNDSTWATRNISLTKFLHLNEEALSLSKDKDFLYDEYNRAMLFHASYLRRTSNYRESLKVLEALLLLDNLSLENSARINQEIGNLLVNQKLPAKALEYYKKSAYYFEKNKDFDGASLQYNNSADCYMDLHKFEAAIAFAKKALNIALVEHNKVRICSFYGTLGEIYFTHGDIQASLYYLKKSISLRGKLILKNQVVTSLFASLASTENGDHIAALNYIEQVKEKVVAMNDNETNSIYFDCLYRYNKSIGRCDVALMYHEKKGAVDAAIKSYDILNQINKIEAFEVLHLVEAEHREKIQSLELKQEEKLQVFLILITFLFLLAALTLLLLLRKNMVNRTLKRQQIVIQNQNALIIEQSSRLRTKHQEVKETNDQLITSITTLQETQQQLIHSEKMASLGQLTAGLAHEINNPLNFISGGVQALNAIHNEFLERKASLAREGESETFMEISSLLKSIENGIGRAQTIIQSLRSFSSPHIVAMDAHVDLVECVENSLVLLNGSVKDSTIKIIKDFQKIPFIKGNFAQLSQVIVNITGNAIHALENTSEAKITFESVKQENNIILKIRDNGPGIAEEFQSKIMSPFFTTKGVGKGTGLGLSISYGIVQNHGGTLSFSSKAGEGTEFVISLPVVY